MWYPFIPCHLFRYLLSLKIADYITSDSRRPLLHALNGTLSIFPGLWQAQWLTGLFIRRVTAPMFAYRMILTGIVGGTYVCRTCCCADLRNAALVVRINRVAYFIILVITYWNALMRDFVTFLFDHLPLPQAGIINWLIFYISTSLTSTEQKIKLWKHNKIQPHGNKNSLHRYRTYKQQDERYQ